MQYNLCISLAFLICIFEEKYPLTLKKAKFNNFFITYNKLCFEKIQNFGTSESKMYNFQRETFLNSIHIYTELTHMRTKVSFAHTCSEKKNNFKIIYICWKLLLL